MSHTIIKQRLRSFEEKEMPQKSEMKEILKRKRNHYKASYRGD